MLPLIVVVQFANWLGDLLPVFTRFEPERAAWRLLEIALSICLIIAVGALSWVLSRSLIGRMVRRMVAVITRPISTAAPANTTTAVQTQASDEPLVLADLADTLLNRPVLVANDEGHEEIGFLTGDGADAIAGPDKVAIFIPGCPFPAAGRLIYVNRDACRPLEGVRARDALKTLLTLGKY